MGGTAPHSAAPRGGSTACAAAGCLDGGNVAVGVSAAPLTLRSSESYYRAICKQMACYLLRPCCTGGAQAGSPRPPPPAPAAQLGRSSYEVGVEGAGELGTLVSLPLQAEWRVLEHSPIGYCIEVATCGGEPGFVLSFEHGEERR